MVMALRSQLFDVVGGAHLAALGESPAEGCDWRRIVRRRVTILSQNNATRYVVQELCGSADSSFGSLLCRADMS
jgi:hypothetical protein